MASDAVGTWSTVGPAAPPCDYGAPEGVIVRVLVVVMLIVAMLGVGGCGRNAVDTSAPDRALADAVARTLRIVTVRGSGAAFVIGDGELVTAAHIVDGLVNVDLMAAGSNPQPARVLGIDGEHDLAVLSADVQGPALPWGDARQLRPGDVVTLLGYPEETGGAPSVLSARVDRVHDVGVLVIDLVAAPELGFSGGPVINVRGEVVGIVSQRTPSGEGVRAIATPAVQAGLAAARAQPPPAAAGVAGALAEWDARLVVLFTQAGSELERVRRGETTPAAARDRYRAWARDALALGDEVAAARPEIAEVNALCECACVDLARSARVLALALTDAAGWLEQPDGLAIATAVLGGAIRDMEAASVLVESCAEEAAPTGDGE